jgi:hypothetical protein
MNERVLYAEDIARLRGISVRQARRWLEEMESQHGAALVGRFPGRGGARRFTTAAALSSIGPVRDRTSDLLVAFVAEVRKRLDALENAVATLRESATLGRA